MTTATSKIEPFVTLVNSFQPLTNAQKNSMLGDAGALDKLLVYILLQS